MIEFLIGSSGLSLLAVAERYRAWKSPQYVGTLDKKPQCSRVGHSRLHGLGSQFGTVVCTSCHVMTDHSSEYPGQPQ